MGKTDFKFQNPEHWQNLKRKKHLSEKWVKKILIISSFTVFVSFLSLKVLWSLDFNKEFFFSKSSKNSVKEESFKKTHTLPLLVNLKGETGPQLTRIQIYITFNASSLEEDLLPKDKKLEKHLLFILSGQSIQALNKKKGYFEKQIRSHLNAFLSKDLINGIDIQTEMLN